MIRSLAILSGLLLAASCLSGQMTISPLPTGGQPTVLRSWAQAILGPGAQVQSAVYTGHPNAIGRLNDPLNATGMRGGLLLGTGRVTTALGSTNQLSSHVFGVNPTSDPWIEVLNVFQSMLYDRASVTIDFVAQSSSLPLAFRFGSEDYLEYVCSNNIDLGGIFISGPGLSGDFPNEGLNLAVVPGTTHVPVCVNTVNTGVTGSEPETFVDNCTAFALNWTSYTAAYAGPISGLVYDGFTAVLPTRPVTLIPGQPYQLRIIIADTGDPGFNSVLLFGNENGGNFTYQDTVSVSAGFCAGESVSLYGQTFFQPGYYEINQTLGDTQRLVQLSIEQYPAYLFTEVLDVCPGEVFYLGDTVLVAPAEYSLVLSTSQGCDSIIHYVLQTQDVDFPVINPLPIVCVGDTLTYVFDRDFGLTGLARPFYNREGFPIPDAAGEASIPILVSGFPEDSVLTDIDHLALCMNLEHSFMYDLEISISCPTGQSVTLHPYNPILPPGVNSTHLGVPFDPDDANAPNALSTPWGPVQPGTGWEYCWAQDATRGTFWEYATANNLSSLPAGTYNTSDPLSDLVGCPLNGEWTFSLTDHWPTDNGYFFEASLDFNRGTPPLVRGWTDLDTNVVAVQGDSLTISFESPGDYAYTFYVAELGGCVYDKVIDVKVRPAIEVQVDTAICGRNFLDVSFESAGDYSLERSFPSLNFCDSLVHYEVHVFFPDTSFVTRTSCSAADIGTSVDVFPGTGACDSVVVTTTLYDPLTAVDTLTTCDPEAVGDFLLVLTTAAGCDSLVTVTYQYAPLAFDVNTTDADCQTGLGSIAIVPLDVSQQYSFVLGSQTSNAGTFNVPPGEYTVTYTSSQACTGSLEVSIGSGQLPLSNFSATLLDCQGIQLQTSQAANTLVTWTLNGVAQQAGEEIVVTGLAVGPVTVCMQARNDCGESDTNCQTFNIADASQAFYSLLMGSGATEPDSCTWIALTATGLENMAYLSGALSLTDTTAGRLVELLPGSLPGGDFDYSLLDPWTAFFEWRGAAPGLSLPDGDTLLLARVCAGSSVAEGVYPIVLDALAAEYCGSGTELSHTPLTIDGSFEVLASLSMAGKIVHHPAHQLSGLGISNVQLSISNTPQVTTDATGFYQRRIVSGGSYTVRPRKNQALAGMSTLNLIRLLRHLNGQWPLGSPYLLLAADADCNQVINYDDLVALRQGLVGGDGNLPGCRTWKFVPRNYTFGLNPLIYPDSLFFAQVTDPVVSADFYGVRTGDVLGTATANRPDAGQLMSLHADDRAYQADEIVSLALRAAEAAPGLAGFQLQLAYDTDAVELLDWQAADPQAGGAYEHEASAGRCRIITYAAEPLGGGTLGWVRLRIKKPLAGLEDVLELAQETSFASEAYDQDLAVYPLKLVFEQNRATDWVLSARPNPFHESTQLMLEVPEAGWLGLEVRDLTGRLLWQEERLVEAGPLSWSLTPSWHTSKGMLVVSLRTRDEVKTLLLNWQ